jgi:hypothetical protein
MTARKSKTATVESMATPADDSNVLAAMFASGPVSIVAPPPTTTTLSSSGLDQTSVTTTATDSLDAMLAIDAQVHEGRGVGDNDDSSSTQMPPAAKRPRVDEPQQRNRHRRQQLQPQCSSSSGGNDAATASGGGGGEDSEFIIRQLLDKSLEESRPTAFLPALPDDAGELCPVVNLRDSYADQWLGKPSPDDKWCFMRNMIAGMQPDSMPSEFRRVVHFVNHSGALGTTKEATQIIAEMYDREIWQPTVKHRTQEKGALRPWTLRSIYRYLTRDANSTRHILEEMIQQTRLEQKVAGNQVFRAPPGMMRGSEPPPLSALVLDKGTFAIEKCLNKQMLDLLTLRSRLDVRDGTSDALGLSSMDGGGGGGGGVAARRKSGGASSVSTLAGTGTSGAGKSTLEQQLRKTQTRPYA